MCLKGHFGEKSSLNPSQFLIPIKNGLAQLCKDDGDKDFQKTMVYCVVNVPCHQEPQKYDMVWELTTFNLTWCDRTKSGVII